VTIITSFSGVTGRWKSSEERSDQMQYTKPELLVAGTALSLIQQVNGAKEAVPGDNISAGHSCYTNELDE